jgi:hypothetical protein
MKKAFQLLALVCLLGLSACGTIQVEVITGGTATPSAGQPYAAPTPFVAGRCAADPSQVDLPANPDDPQSYVGQHYNERRLPDGLVFKASGVIDDYFAWLWVSRPYIDMAFIEKIDCLLEDGSPYYTVVDAIRIPRETGGYGRAGYCLPDRSSGPFLIFGKYDTSEPQVGLGAEKGWKMFDLDFGQQVDLKTMHFAPLSLQDVACLRLPRQNGE